MHWGWGDLDVYSLTEELLAGGGGAQVASSA